MTNDPSTQPNAESDPRDASDGAASAPEALQQEIETHKDRYLRLAADFGNYKRRMEAEAERRARAQKEAFITELLPVIDNLERALSNGQSASAEQLRGGVQMTLQQLYQLLKQHGYEPEDCLGQPFDPHRHEAVATHCDPAQPDHVILAVYQRGWRHGDHLVRPAKVVVNDLQKVSPSHGG